MSLRRSGEGSRPTLAVDTRATVSQSQPSPSRSVHFPDSPAARRTKTRVIRTFEEIERIVPQEQWYEELECGICAHVLGAVQSLVPCGHSFCGPCAWTWIKINDNQTCPQCRMPVNGDIPLIPNLIVDQIIERKLEGLPDGQEKADMRMERITKAAEWKVLRDSLVPMKLLPKRTRGPFETLSGMFDNNATGHQRRASRYLPELGPPVQRQEYVGLTLSDIARLDASESTRADQRVLAERAAQRRVRDSVLSGQARAPSSMPRTPVAADQAFPRPATPARHRTESGDSQVDFSPGRGTFEDRSGITRSRAFNSRQARGRDGVSREMALVVDSDSDDA